jgi:hypothetical protein
MKKKFVKVLSLYLISSTCFACTSTLDNLVDRGTPIIESSSALIADVKASTIFLGWSNVGDTTISVKADKDVLPALPTTKANIASITTNLEGGFRLLSVGGSLSAGFRDGGLYREGQLTAFPNLVARQMGVTLNQPLFDAIDGNGSGYKTLVGIEPIASFKMVTNNLGYTDNTKADKLKPFTGNNIDSYAFPNMNTWLKYISYNPNNNIGEKFANRFFINPQKDDSYNYEALKNQSCDFFIFEAGLDDLVANISLGSAGGISGGANPVNETAGTLLVQNLVDKKARGVLLNVPDVLDLPYFSQITNDKINKLTGVVIRVKDNGTPQVDVAGYRDFNPIIDKLIPTPLVEKLIKGELKGLALLSDSDVLSRVSYDDEWLGVSPTSYNSAKINTKAKATNIPVVDIYGLYKKIIAGTYTTDDGVKVNPDWAKGNFFSADGIYPTAFGQAVIANEVIKSMNQFYKLSIPLVDTRFFLKK